MYAVYSPIPQGRCQVRILGGILKKDNADTIIRFVAKRRTAAQGRCGMQTSLEAMRARGDRFTWTQEGGPQRRGRTAESEEATVRYEETRRVAAKEDGKTEGRERLEKESEQV